MPDTKRLKGKRVLIVDDEPDILDVLEELLEGCEVARGSTLEEAKALMASQEFDIAILDIMGVDGYGLLKIAKQKHIIPIMLTAHAFTPGNLVRSIKEGADSYLPKEEITHIVTFLNDVLEAREKGENPWGPWQERLPTSYFEKRWGAAWQNRDKDFWETFRASIKERKK
ncbi:MAG: response regulator [Thermodesulfobacteriota bacterium]